MLPTVNTAGFNKSNINSFTNKVGTRRSGLPEGPNVNISEEIVGQAVSNLTFKANTNVITAYDDMLGTILGLKS